MVPFVLSIFTTFFVDARGCMPGLVFGQVPLFWANGGPVKAAMCSLVLQPFSARRQKSKQKGELSSIVRGREEEGGERR